MLVARKASFYPSSYSKNNRSARTHARERRMLIYSRIFSKMLYLPAIHLNGGMQLLNDTVQLHQVWFFSWHVRAHLWLEERALHAWECSMDHK